MFEFQNLSICCVLSPLRINSKGGHARIADTKHVEVCGVQKQTDTPRKTGGRQQGAENPELWRFLWRSFLWRAVGWRMSVLPVII